MSGTLTVAFRRRIIDLVYRGTPLGFDHFQAAFTRKTPSSNSSPDQLDEPVGLGYARQSIPLDATNFSMTAAGEAANALDVIFPAATGAWGVLTGWALISVETTPIVCEVGTLVQPWRVLTGDVPFIPALTLVQGLYD